jgi:teichuronic acid biosynthesis glycosyltransferase TuaG
MSSKFTVVIPCYKMGAYLEAALTSIKNQTYPNWEIIIVDDCCPENTTSKIVSSFIQQCAPEKVRFFKHNVNQGVSAARNTAISNATGDYIAFLDPDDIWLPNHLSTKLEFFINHPNLNFCFSPAYLFESTPKKTQAIECPATWEVNSLPYSLGFRCKIALSSVVIRRSHIILFDTDPNLQHVEDWDLWLRLSFNGIQLGFSPILTTFYRKHSGGATQNLQLNNTRVHNLARKHGSLFSEYQTVAFGSLVYTLNNSNKSKPLFNSTRSWKERISLSGLTRFISRLNRSNF